MAASSCRPYAGASRRTALLIELGLIGLVLSVSARAATLSEPEPGPAPGGDAAAQAADALLFASPTTHDHVGRIVVPVKVNGRGPFRFVVDTGADHSTISPGLARTLGLAPAKTASFVLEGVTGTAQVSFVTVQSLQAGALDLPATMLPVVWAPVMAGADGILGAAGLTEKSLVVDFERNRVTIDRAVAPTLRNASTRIQAFRPTHGLITIHAKVGTTHVLAVIDTGAERTLGNLALRDALKARRKTGSLAYVTSVYGATAEVESGEIQAAPQIELEGALHITDVSIVYGDFHIFKVWDMEHTPALIIGMDVLGTVASLGIDFKSQEVYIASVRSGGMPFGTHGGVLGDQAMKR